MTRSFLTAIAAGALIGLAGSASAEECGAVTVANMNWPSAEVLAHIDNIILSEGYGCDVELVPGDTMPTFTSMNEKSEPDVAPEVFRCALPNYQSAVEPERGAARFALVTRPDLAN